jgi:peptidyl-tRNA hydrolase, PTH2 family
MSSPTPLPPSPFPIFLPPEENIPQVAEQRIDPKSATITVIGARGVKQIIIIRKDLRMGRGKEIAQGAHAAMAWLSHRLIHDQNTNTALAQFSDAERQWLMTSFRKVTLQVNSEEELLAIYNRAEATGLQVHLITDSGLTVFHGQPTITCLAIGPDYDDKIDPVTSELRMY